MGNFGLRALSKRNTEDSAPLITSGWVIRRLSVHPDNSDRCDFRKTTNPEKTTNSKLGQVLNTT